MSSREGSRAAAHAAARAYEALVAAEDGIVEALALCAYRRRLVEEIHSLGFEASPAAGLAEAARRAAVEALLEACQKHKIAEEALDGLLLSSAF